MQLGQSSHAILPRCSVGPTSLLPRELLSVPSRCIRPPCGFSRSVGMSSYRAGGVSVLRRTAESAGVRMGPKGMVAAVSSLRNPVSIRLRRLFDES